MHILIDNPCDCIEGFCSHFNSIFEGKRYKLLHSLTKEGKAFRRVLLGDFDKPKEIKSELTLDKIGSFLKTFIKHLQNDKKEVDFKTYQNRLTVCFNCDKCTKNWICTECGCNLELKAKWDVSKCPLDKWKRIELAVLDGSVNKSPCGCGS